MNITIQDSGDVTMDDLNYNFFVGAEDIGKNVHLFLFIFVFCYLNSIM